MVQGEMSSGTSIMALMREDEEATRTLLDLLTTDKMDGPDSSTNSTSTVSTITITTAEEAPPQSPTARSDGPNRRWRQRLRLKAIICCGSNLSRSSSSSSALLPEDEEEGFESPAAAVNLATALAEERQLRNLTTAATATPPKVSLMRLMAEAAMEGCEEEEVGRSGCCCVCMERSKGAAFIPCGHTFCRICSREIWLNRGHCPLCNRSILDLLDIF